MCTSISNKLLMRIGPCVGWCVCVCVQLLQARRSVVPVHAAPAKPSLGIITRTCQCLTNTRCCAWNNFGLVMRLAKHEDYSQCDSSKTIFEPLDHFILFLIGCVKGKRRVKCMFEKQTVWLIHVYICTYTRANTHLDLHKLGQRKVTQHLLWIITYRQRRRLPRDRCDAWLAEDQWLASVMEVNTPACV